MTEKLTDSTRLHTASLGDKTEVYEYGHTKYPRRPSDESAKYCIRHEIKQKRKIDVEGPMEEFYCRYIPSRSPRNSHWLIWKFTIIGWWLITPIKGQWYIIRGSGNCDLCPEPHLDKWYRREFGRLGLFFFRIKAFIFPESYSITPYKQK